MSNISAALAAVFIAKGQAVNLLAGHSILMSRQQEAARAQSVHKTKKNCSIWPAVTAGRGHWRYLHNDLLWHDPIVLRLCIFPEKTGKPTLRPVPSAGGEKLIRLMARNQYDELNNWSDAVNLLP